MELVANKLDRSDPFVFDRSNFFRTTPRGGTKSSINVSIPSSLSRKFRNPIRRLVGGSCSKAVPSLKKKFAGRNRSSGARLTLRPRVRGHCPSVCDNKGRELIERATSISFCGRHAKSRVRGWLLYLPANTPPTYSLAS